MTETCLRCDKQVTPTGASMYDVVTVNRDGTEFLGNQFRYRATGYPSREAATRWAEALKAAKSPTCRGIFVVDRDKE